MIMSLCQNVFECISCVCTHFFLTDRVFPRNLNFKLEKSSETSEPNMELANPPSIDDQEIYPTKQFYAA